MIFKRTLCVVLSILVSISIPSITYAGNDESTERILLSSLSPQEAIEKIQTMGVNIPQNFLEKQSLGEFIIGIFRAIEADSEWCNPFNIEETYNFVEDVRIAVLNYYNQSNNYKLISKNILEMNSTSSTTSLLYSTVIEFNNSLLNARQNCYGYAIGKYEKLQPGYTMGYNYSTDASIITYAGAVAYDLRNLGYSDATYSSTKPTTIPSGKHLIAIRKSDWDFHLMKYNNSRWEHKPGLQLPMYFFSQNLTSGKWTNEGYGKPSSDMRFYYSNIYNAPTTEYNSQIYYIIY